MFISIGIDEDGRPYITTSDGSREKVVRKGKGKSVIDFPSTYTVLDIETTGLDPRYCEIIEISAMKYSSGQNIGTFSTLVKPSEPIDEYITSLTGITNDMLKSAPDISETMQKFYNFVGSDLIVGYNVNFDINFLYDNLLNCRSLILSNSFIDVMRIARKILPGLKNHKQATVADHYGISTAGAHRAAVDCEICNAIFEKLQADILATGQSMAGANLLLANDIPVTTDSVRAYMQMQAQIGKDIGELPTAQQAEKRQTQELETRAAKLRQDAASITAEDVAQAVRTERTLTIAALGAAHYDGVRDGQTGGQPVGAYDETADKGTQLQDGRSAGSDIQNQTLREVTALRQLEEIRLT